LCQLQVLAFIPFSKSTLKRRLNAGTLAAPVKLLINVTAWRAGDIRRWIAKQKEA
jgi:predicted DNA-binding transcriptional regulator AlpA